MSYDVTKMAFNKQLICTTQNTYKNLQSKQNKKIFSEIYSVREEKWPCVRSERVSLYGLKSGDQVFIPRKY